MERVRLPLGIEDFSEIRSQHLYYVDKTDMIAEFIRYPATAALFTRPRRFGKTLTMSMLKNFFEIGADKTLFDGLAISKEKELCEQYMGQYPVISISFKDITGSTFEEAYESLRSTIREEYQRFRFLGESKIFSDAELRSFVRILDDKDESIDIHTALLTLSRLLRKYYNKRTIILIDEYDVPFNEANKFGYYDKMFNVIRGMLSCSLKGNESLEFGMLTGCLNISLNESYFTGFNNLKMFSVDDSGYAEYFGFTEREVFELLKYYGLESHMDEVREWYGGYRFGRANVYSPWDVLNYCSDLLTDPETKPKPYWANTSGNDIVRKLIDIADASTRYDIERLIGGEVIEKSIDTILIYQDKYKNKDDLWSVLYMTGYLLSVGDTPYLGRKLVIPNKAVREAYVLLIREWFETFMCETDYVKDLCEAFLERDAEKVEASLNTIFEMTIIILDTKASDEQKGKFYHDFLIELLMNKRDWSVKPGVASDDGFRDILIEPDNSNSGYVLELKYVSDYSVIDKVCEAAVKQIKDKKYDERLRKDGRSDIGAYGIAFLNKHCRVRFEAL